MKKIKFFIGTVMPAWLIVFLFAAVSTAATITQTEYLTSTTLNFVDTLTFDKYNGAYTLESVEVIFYLEIDGGWMGVDNDSESESATVIVEMGATSEITSNTVRLYSTNAFPQDKIGDEVRASGGATYNLDKEIDGDGAGNFDTSGDDYAEYTGTAESGSDQGFIHSDYFGDYTGSGTFNISADVDSYTDFGGVGGIEWAGGSPTVTGGYATIIYTDSGPAAAVPAPATALLFGGGLITLLGIGRIGARKSSKRRSRTGVV